MSRSTLIVRSIVSVALLMLFVLGATYLYQKQQLRINFLSFRLEQAEHSFIVPDINRLVDKIDHASDLEMQNWPASLETGIDSVLRHKDYSFNRELAQTCFISYNKSDFVVVFNTTSSIGSLTEVVKKEFQVAVHAADGKLTIQNTELYTNHYGNYLAISSQPLVPVEREDKLYYGNADYVVFDDSTATGVRHILSKKYHFSLWEEKRGQLKGRPVKHQEYFSEVPADFERLAFYGSSRMMEDVSTFFVNPAPESFDWVSDGIIYVKKGDFELLLAKQGESRDLSLMLEEQTLLEKGDSAQLTHFNIGKFKVLSFETTFNWDTAIPDLNERPQFYTEYKNFNVLSNSIPAMRWYLGQVQLGNLLGNNKQLYQTYDECLPELAHHVNFTRDSTGQYTCESDIYEMDGTCLISSVVSGARQVQVQGVEIVHNFPVDIVPTHLTAVTQKGEKLLLVSNQSQLSLYHTNGQKQWALQLSTPLVESPQVVDFENDGLYEYVLFQSNQIDVVNSKGKSLNGFPVLIGGTSRAGLTVNYDNSYNHRLLVNVDNTVKVFSEEGKVVEGWMFTGMSAPLKGKIYHVIAEGKDIITFKDNSNFQHVLSRRGEYRLNKEIRFGLPNETDFVVGSLDAALRKMGYKNGFIYNYYILDGVKDSISIDQKVTPIRTFWEYNEGQPLLIVEEPGRLLIVNQFGYVMSEVLKPTQTNEFVGLVGKKDHGYVFADNSENSIYLLNSYGKMILPNAVEGSAVSMIEGKLLYTFSGTSVRAYKIAD